MTDILNKVYIEEQIGKTISTGTLAGPSLNRIIALGIVGIHEKLATAVFRLKYANDAKSYPEALEGVKALVSGINMRKHWRLNGKHRGEIAKEVLDYWLSDTCPACEGRGWERDLGVPYLSDRPCKSCSDIPGKRPFPWLLKMPKVRIREKASKDRKRELVKRRERFAAHIERHKHVLCALEDIERQIGSLVIGAMARDVRAMKAVVREGEED